MPPHKKNLRILKISTAALAASRVRNCPKCGEKYPIGAKVCPNCGTPRPGF